MMKTFRHVLIVFVLLLSVTYVPAQIINEEKVPPYTLPDPLTFLDGSKVKTKKQWKKRRAEIMEMAENEMYGRSPGKPANRKFTVFDIEEHALNGKATRKRVTVSFTDSSNGPPLDSLVYYPNAVKGKVPVFLGLNFPGNHGVHNDPAIKLSPN